MAHFIEPKMRECIYSTKILLNKVKIRFVKDSELTDFNEQLQIHHYLKSSDIEGQALRYVATIDGQWLGLLSWGKASYGLKDRDNAIGWTAEQREERLNLLVEQKDFLILPWIDIPGLASKLLELNAKRIQKDWLEKYKKKILLVEAFVDPQIFKESTYKACGWESLGKRNQFSKIKEDFYTSNKNPALPQNLWGEMGQFLLFNTLHFTTSSRSYRFAISIATGKLRKRGSMQVRKRFRQFQRVQLPPGKG